MYTYGLHASCPSEQKEALVNLESTSAEVSIRGFVAHLSINLVYRNDSSEAVDVSYVCPVDAKAAVYKFEARLEGRTIIGQCLEKKKAENIYKNAVKQGHTAILGREDSRAGDILHLALGNLPKGETAELKLGIVTELPVETDGALSFTLPTVFNPRYCPSDQTPELYDPELSSSVIPSRTRYVMDVGADVQGSLKIARIISASDPISVELSDEETAAKITQDGGSNLDHDWSFKVYYETPHQPTVLQMAGDRTGTGIMKDDVIMLNLFPEVPLEGFSPHNELIFVIDRSGSMQGPRIEKAKSTLLLFLKSLPHGCRFNIISFGNSYSALFSGSSERYTEETLKKAIELQKTMDADMGGTEILDALKYIYSQKLVQGYARQIIVLTDGSVWNQDQIFKLVARFADEARVFAVGIGDGASTGLVQGMAKAGRGRSEMVVQEDQLQMKVMGLIASMLQEPIKDLKIECDLEPTQTVTIVPKIPPYMYGGQQMILYGRLSPKTKVKSVKVTWKMSNQEVVSEIPESHHKIIHDSNYSFHRLAAKAQLEQWELEDKEDVDDLIRWSEASGVVCKVTSFVGIDHDRKTIRESSPPTPVFCMMAAAHSQRIGGMSNIQFEAQAYSCAPVASHRKKSRRCEMFAEVLEKEEMLESCDDMSEISPEGVPKLSDDPFFKVVTSQNFDGSWKIEDCLEFFSAKEDCLRQIQTQLSLDDECFATAVTLAYLESTFASRKPEWMLLHAKGKSFLESKGVDASSVIENCMRELKSRNIL